MRYRNTVVAVACALAAAFCFPASAHAAEGDFIYRYVGEYGSHEIGGLVDPPSRECITLPEVSDPDETEPAFAPLNDTNATATVFTGVGCDGDYYTLRPNGGHASERLKLRSVVFS